jgi:cell wall assembly regulator SMI1
MNPLLTRLDAWFRKHRARYAKNLQPGASSAELDALAKAIGRPLPASLRTWLGWHNGQGDDYAGYFVDHWLPISASAIAAAKADLDAVGLEHGWNKQWLPFLDDDGGNFVVLDLAQPEPPVKAFWMDAQPETWAASLEAWVAQFVTAVEAGQFSEDPERGTFQRTAKP